MRKQASTCEFIRSPRDVELAGVDPFQDHGREALDRDLALSAVEADPGVDDLEGVGVHETREPFAAQDESTSMSRRPLALVASTCPPAAASASSIRSSSLRWTGRAPADDGGNDRWPSSLLFALPLDVVEDRAGRFLAFVGERSHLEPNFGRRNDGVPLAREAHHDRVAECGPQRCGDPAEPGERAPLFERLPHRLFCAGLVLQGLEQQRADRPAARHDRGERRASPSAARKSTSARASVVHEVFLEHMPMHGREILEVRPRRQARSARPSRPEIENSIQPGSASAHDPEPAIARASTNGPPR